MFAQRLADILAHGFQESVGDTAADHQLIDLLRQAFQHGQLGRNLGAADDGDQRPGRLGQRLGQRVEFLGQQDAGASHRRVFGDAVGGGFGAMRGAEGVHDEDIAQGGIFLRGLLDVFLLALVGADVFEQHHFAVGHLKPAVDPVADHPHRLT